MIKYSELGQLTTRLTEQSNELLRKFTIPHPFIQNLLSHIGWSVDDWRDFVTNKNLELSKSFSRSRVDEGPQSSPRIEQICHKIWLTAEEDPHFPNADLFDRYLQMCGSFSTEWVNYFWTNSDEVANWISDKARKSGVRVLPLNIRGVHFGQIEGTVQTLIKDRKFVLAADVLKCVVLNRFGGLYSDLGVFFEQPILDLVSAADYTFWFANNMFFQTSWASSRKGSFLSRMFLAVMNNPETFSSTYAFDESNSVHAGTEVHTFAGLGYSACALFFLPPTAMCFTFAELLPDIVSAGQQSWYGDAPKYGNVLINKSLPSVFRYENYREYAERASARLSSVNVSRRLVESATIVVKLFEYLQTCPGDLGGHFAFHETDQWGTWHNYGVMHDFLIKRIPRSDLNVLLIADYDSLWGKRLESGAISGGMALAWQDLGSTHVDGLEVIRSSGFELTLRTPLSLNQRVTSSLSERLSSTRYDVIVDNGIHHFDTAITLLEGSAHALKPGGLHLVEAVPLGDLARWQEYLLDSKQAGLIFNLPNQINPNDNCLVAILRDSE